MYTIRMARRDKILTIPYLCAIVLIYSALPTLILVGVIPWDMKFVALVVGAVIMYILMRMFGSTNGDLGITHHRTIYSLRAALPMTVVVFVAAGMFLLFGKPRFSPTEGLGFYIFYIFISCPAQELLFRGILSRILKELRLHRVFELSVAAILFGYVHIIYGDIFTVGIMSMVGLFWYLTYEQSSNLIGVTVSHIILGVATIALGIID